jgi:hypothetical protein
MCIYGIELLADNVQECRAILLSTFDSFLSISENDVWHKAAAAVLKVNILLGDAKEKIYDLDDDYDLIIFGDVLEHFTKEDGENLLKISLKKSRYVIVAVPIGENWEQDEMYGNIYERHLASWYVDEFKSFHCTQGKLFRDFIDRPHGVFLLSLNSPSIASDYIFDYYDSATSQCQQELLEIKKSRTWKVIEILKSNYLLKAIFGKILSFIIKI